MATKKTATKKTATKKTAAKKTAAKKTAAKKTAAKKTATKKPALKKSAAKKPAARADLPSLSDLVELLGQHAEDDAVEHLRTTFGFKREKADRVKGEPHTTWLRNDKLGVVLTGEDNVVVGVSVDEVYAGRLFDGVAFGQTREATRAALGDVVHEQRFYDVFRRGGFRVTINAIRDALVGIEVEPWQLQEKRNRDERVENASAPDVVVTPRPPLPEAWAKTLPTVTALRALLGQRAADTVLARLEASGHLRRDGGDSGALLIDDDASVTIGLDAAGIVGNVHVGMHWTGGYEDGFTAGAVGRKEARAKYGPPKDEASSFDIWECDGLRRQVSYLFGHVMSWQLQPISPDAAPGRRRTS